MPIFEPRAATGLEIGIDRRRIGDQRVAARIDAWKPDDSFQSRTFTSSSVTIMNFVIMTATGTTDTERGA